MPYSRDVLYNIDLGIDEIEDAVCKLKYSLLENK
jgi:hypothetical protein